MVVLVDVDVSFNSNHHGVGKACNHGFDWPKTVICLEINGTYGCGYGKKHGTTHVNKNVIIHMSCQIILLMLFVLSFTLLEQHQKHVVQFGGVEDLFFLGVFWMEDIVI